MRTRLPSPSHSRPLRVSVLAGDGLMRQRLAVLERHSLVVLHYSDEAVADADAYVVAARDLGRIAGLGLLERPPGASFPLVVAFGSAEHLRGAFLAGCDDYLKEPWDPDELEARLLRLAERSAERRAALGGGYELDGRRMRLPDGREVLLSAHEAVVASLLLANRGAVVSRRALSYALWGHLPRQPSRAIDMHVSALRRKIGQGSISCVRGQGYVVD